MNEFDVFIRNATIVEGTGKKAYKGSIGIVGDRICSIGYIKGDGKELIDATGLTAIPGFVDAHSHADNNFLEYPNCENMVMQGVTTVVAGQCGGSPAPLGEYIGRLPHVLIEKIPAPRYKYYPERERYTRDKVNEWLREFKVGWTIDWKTMSDYFKVVEKAGISLNYAPLVGHGTIRSYIMGEDYKRHATEQELKQIRELLAEAMEDGCIGMSTGEDYDPDIFASHEEIIDGVKVLKKYNGVYVPHWRRTGRRRGIAAGQVLNEKIKGLMDCVDVYRKTGVRTHFAHLFEGWEIYPTPPDELERENVKKTIDWIARESKGELDITYDHIPFVWRGGYYVMPYLCSLYEPWLRELGSREAFGEWLKDKGFREEVKDAILRGKWYIVHMANPNTNPMWAEWVTVVKSKSPGLVGKSIADIAKERNNDAWDTYFDIITEDPDTRSVRGYGFNDLCRSEYLLHPAGMVGLDCGLVNDEYEMKRPPYSIGTFHHFSGYTRIYTHYVRDLGLLTIEEAVQKTASMAARVYNLDGRGVLRQGSYADIVLLDMPNLTVLGDQVEPRRYPKGVEHVLVNGVVVVEKGRHTGARPGRVLKRTTMASSSEPSGT